jgi:enoyl-CoA hydratase/carnithine racemase
MCQTIDAALKGWRDDAEVALVVIDAEGERAFCAGGDLTQMYETGRAGDYEYGRRFWADEYRMNARIAEYPKPVVSFLQGFTLGGGVGLACHARHRIVGASSQIAMPECSVGLVPDVGGSYLLARAAGHLGEYLGTTGARMGPYDAILAGFADHFIPEQHWRYLKKQLCNTGNTSPIEALCKPPPKGRLAELQGDIDRLFGGGSLDRIITALAADPSDFATETLALLRRPSPLSMACTVEMLGRLRPNLTLRLALQQEYRFSHRAMQDADFLEGIRSAIIDKDRRPVWRHASVAAVSPLEIADLLAPLGNHELTFTKATT